MFFGQSFSRIGADFRNLLIPLFQKAALLQLEKDVRIANIKFDETLSCFSLMEAQPLSTSTTFLPETQDKTRPPLTLMEFAPLAHYMNGLVAAFNTLRQCCPVATLSDALKLLHQSLAKVISALLELHRLESSGFTVREAEAFQRMCVLVAHDLLPHTNKCLRFLYPLQQVSLITGVSVNQLQREKCGQLNAEELLSPIQHLLPKKEEDVPELNMKTTVIPSDLSGISQVSVTCGQGDKDTTTLPPLPAEPKCGITTAEDKTETAVGDCRSSEESGKVTEADCAGKVLDTKETGDSSSQVSESQSVPVELSLTVESIEPICNQSLDLTDTSVAEPVESHKFY